MHQSFVTTASPKPLSRMGILCAMFLLLRCLHNAEEMKGFDRSRQTLLCSIKTDCGGEQSCFFHLAAPTVWCLLWGTADTKSKPPTFL